MLRYFLAGFALVLGLVSTANAADPTPLEAAALTCIGPGFVSEVDPFEILATIPPKDCVRACKAATAGCKAVVKSIGKCGVSFLKATAKTGIAICRGIGGTSQQCRVINDDIKLDINSWKAGGKQELDQCDVDAQTFCLSRC